MFWIGIGNNISKKNNNNKKKIKHKIMKNKMSQENTASTIYFLHSKIVNYIFVKRYHHRGCSNWNRLFIK